MNFSSLRSKFTFAISKAAVSRILMVAKSKVKRVVEFFNSVWVWVKGHRPTFVSKRAFLRDFQISRIDKSQNLQLIGMQSSRLQTQWTVYNPDNEHYNRVTQNHQTGTWSCGCDDKSAHSNGIPCKHICKTRWGLNPDTDFKV